MTGRLARQPQTWLFPPPPSQPGFSDSYGHCTYGHKGAGQIHLITRQLPLSLAATTVFWSVTNKKCKQRPQNLRTRWKYERSSCLLIVNLFSIFSQGREMQPTFFFIVILSAVFQNLDKIVRFLPQTHGNASVQKINSDAYPRMPLLKIIEAYLKESSMTDLFPHLFELPKKFF